MRQWEINNKKGNSLINVFLEYLLFLIFPFYSVGALQLKHHTLDRNHLFK